MASDTPKPVHLTVQESPDGVELVVPGAADDARSDLEVDSKGAGGTTRTVQSGTNRAGGAGGVLLRSTIRTSGLTQWTARMWVHSAGGEYSETCSSGG
ncbi:hypothetical protein JW805_20850 [Roseomonas aeriglobus]|nr:hypothetical protein [Roseomonas aeriglobus]